jgi:hypothetical protein
MTKQMLGSLMKHDDPKPDYPKPDYPKPDYPKSDEENLTCQKESRRQIFFQNLFFAISVIMLGCLVAWSRTVRPSIIDVF